MPLANSYSGADRRAKRQSARIRAAIFLLNQKRAKAPPRLGDPDRRRPGCRRQVPKPAASAHRPKGTVVRSIAMVVKGYYRTGGGWREPSTARSATFNTGGPV